MSIFDTDLIGGVSKGLKNFSYGHHPSIVMWSNGPASQKEEESGLFGGFAKALESLPIVLTLLNSMRLLVKNMIPKQP